MSAADYNLPEDLEALLQEVCREQGVPPREHDELRSLLSTPEDSWPGCCSGSCSPCVEEPKSVAREVLRRWSSARG